MAQMTVRPALSGVYFAEAIGSSHAKVSTYAGVDEETTRAPAGSRWKLWIMTDLGAVHHDFHLAYLHELLYWGGKP